MSMVGMKLIPLGVISLWVWVGRLLGPFDSVAHVLHDCDYLYGIYVEVILWKSSAVNRNCKMVVCLS